MPEDDRNSKRVISSDDGKPAIAWLKQ